MKIERIATTLVDVPLRAPIGTAIHSIRSVGCVLVDVTTVDGAIGQSFAFTLNGDRLRALDETVTGLAHLAVGRPVYETTAIWDAIWNEINPTGHKGTTVSALSAIDVACWDAWGRTLGQPLHRVFGACRDSVDTYASSGLWLNASIDELVAEAAEFVAQGFRAVKLRIGSDDPDVDVARVRAVRTAVGDDIGLLVDANQKFTPKQAIRLGRRLEEFGLLWFEEPVSADDLVGHADARAALDTPIASGETEYTRFGMQAMLDARAADVLMPDLQRIGGYTEFRRAAAAAASRHVPVSSHFFTEHSLALAGSLSNCISVEHVDWFAPLFHEHAELCDGRLLVPDRPGHGFTFDPAAVDRYRVR
ncbi:MAG: mandelate racemase/muconate lactonizing enzyme family protein [Ilumatobacter sp.]|nr:mandelate racemase/muconate lactonizing enzyme family protein [Ilumatobacter sp.]